MRGQTLTALTTDSAAEIAGSSKAAAQQLSGATQQLQASQQALADAAQAAHSADEALAGEVATAAASVASQLDSAAGQHAAQLADVVSSIGSATSGRLGVAPPALPPPKAVDVPLAGLVEQLCCPPETVLLEHFRVQRQQVIEVRGAGHRWLAGCRRTVAGARAGAWA